MEGMIGGVRAAEKRRRRWRQERLERNENLYTHSHVCGRVLEHSALCLRPDSTGTAEQNLSRHARERRRVSEDRTV